MPGLAHQRRMLYYDSGRFDGQGDPLNRLREAEQIGSGEDYEPVLCEWCNLEDGFSVA
jgi:hypothetical protein